MVSLLGTRGTLSLYLVVVHTNFSLSSELPTCVSYVISKLESFLMTGVIAHPPSAGGVTRNPTYCHSGCVCVIMRRPFVSAWLLKLGTSPGLGKVVG